ncbi:DsbA family protein [Massilia suwonensis]|uniref:DsbA family protein n=1 Tax=Massilia suwonensis TaxID=648895 RepID=A0ABW0MQW3_9BURK
MSDSIRIEENDHLRGPRDAEVTLVEYGDFQCPYCARAHAALDQLMHQHQGRVALVYRHLPLSDLHPFAARAAEAAEAAGAQGKFWEMHDALFENQAMASEDALPGIAASLGLDAQRFVRELDEGKHRAGVAAHAEQARAHGASGTPTFFINGERYHGDSDQASLAAALQEALGRA